MLELITSRIAPFSFASLVLKRYVAIEGHAEQKSEPGWQILLMHRGQDDGSTPGRLRLALMRRRARPDLGISLTHHDDPRIDFFVPYRATDKDEGLSFSVNRITGRYASLYQLQDQPVQQCRRLAWSRPRRSSN